MQFITWWHLEKPNTQTFTMARFQTVIKRARFVYSPYAPTEMQGFAQVLADSIRACIQSGRDLYDQAAAPLKLGLSGRRGYPDYKATRGLQPIRDWTWSGQRTYPAVPQGLNGERESRGPRVPARSFDAAIPSKNTNSGLRNRVWLFTNIPIVETAESRWKQDAGMAAIFLSETSVFD